MSNALLQMIAAGSNVGGSLADGYAKGLMLRNQQQRNALAMQPTMGLTPIFDDSGGMYQLSNRGGVLPVNPPGGSSRFVKPMVMRDAGGYQEGLDPYTAQPRTARLPKTLPPQELPQVQADQRVAIKQAEERARLAAERPLAEQKYRAFRAKNASLIKEIEDAKKMTTGWTTGPGEMLSGVPMSPQRALRNKLKTIRSKLTLQELRDLKESGATLGAIAVPELEMLEAAAGQLDQAQSAEEIDAVLDTIAAGLMSAEDRLVQNFGALYQGGSPAVPGGGARSAPQGGGPQGKTVVRGGQRYMVTPDGAYLLGPE